MRAGSLNETITVEQAVTEKNELGEVVENLWAKKFSTKAQVIYKSGQREEDYSIYTDYTVQFVIRYYHQVSETDRIIYRNKPFRIESIEYSREYQMIKINARLIQND